MSLLRLLATGKSLIGVKDTDSPYRMTTQNLLPKFPLAKNPFVSAASLEPAQGAPAPAPASPAEVAGHEAAKMETVPLFAPEPKPSSARELMRDAGQALTASTEKAQAVPQPGSFNRLASDKKPSLLAALMKKTQPVHALGKKSAGCKKDGQIKDGKISSPDGTVFGEGPGGAK